MQKIILLLAAYCVPLISTGQPSGEIFTGKEETHVYAIGNRRITLKTTRYGQNRRVVMLSLHSNETTSIAAARSVLERSGGILLSLENDGERFVTFTRRGQSYTFDPNRIFTKTGARATLRQHSRHHARDAVRSVEGLARFLLRKIPATAVLIALHNNDDGGWSLDSYKTGKDAAGIHQPEGRDPDDFFLVTDRKLFQSLRSAGYNVVLQHNRRAHDDGSLSIYYGRKQKPYVNVEAETGKTSEQAAMIDAVVRIVLQNAAK